VVQSWVSDSYQNSTSIKKIIVIVKNNLKKGRKGKQKSLEPGVRSMVGGGKEVDCNSKTPFAGKQRAINVIAV